MSAERSELTGKEWEDWREDLISDLCDTFACNRNEEQALIDWLDDVAESQVFVTKEQLVTFVNEVIDNHNRNLQ